jgi:hypothetical protein
VTATSPQRAGNRLVTLWPHRLSNVGHTANATQHKPAKRRTRLPCPIHEGGQHQIPTGSTQAELVLRESVRQPDSSKRDGRQEQFAQLEEDRFRFWVLTSLRATLIRALRGPQRWSIDFDKKSGVVQGFLIQDH